MKKIYIFYLCFIITIFISTLALSQTIVFEDKFDTYTVDQMLACQNPTVWTTWNLNPCSPIEDPFISNVYSYSGGNSIVIKQYNDLVRDHGLLTNGICEINFQIYIPTGKAGYFNTLADFATPNYIWAMQVFFNSNSTGTLDAGAQNAAAFSYPQNNWFPVKIVADLVADSAEFWLDGVLIHSWQWSKGTFGSPTIPLQLDGSDFYGNTVNDEMYVDDYNIVYTPYNNKISSTPTGGNWNTGSTWVGGNVPNQNRAAEIVSGATVNLTRNINRNALTIVKGKLNCGTFNITGSGDFVLASNATLQIGSLAGISLTGATGNVRVSGIRSFNLFANYIYNGIAAQVTGNGLPSSVKNLTINNSSGVTLSSNTTVSESLDLIIGSLITNSNTLTLGTSITNLGTLFYSSGIILGKFNRWFSNSAGPDVLFPVGTSPSKYTPVTLNNVVGNGNFTVSAISGKHPNSSGTNVLQMYWKLTNGGITSTDLTFNYLDADVVGDETQYELAKYDGNWIFPSPSIINNAANTIRINGINTFSDWTLGEPVALPVELSSFTASIIRDNVRLNWKTETEVNNYGFDVERNTPLNPLSRGEAEGRGAWEKIGFVNGNGNSNSPQNYSFLDDNVSSGIYFYRLKQIDNDGRYEYSSVVEIDLGNSTEFSLEQNYPNPFNPNTTISFTLPKSGNVKLTIFNLLGQEVRSLVNDYKEVGTHIINFNASEFNSGVYIYKLEANGVTQTRKMMLIK